jgi:uncharacterized protein (DUF362 family)
MNRSLNRRQFLKLMTMSGLSLLLNKCGVGPAIQDIATDTPYPSPDPTKVSFPSPTATLSPTPTTVSNYESLAVIGRASSYDIVLLRKEMSTMFDQLGGLGNIVKSGARVGIKPNLTGGTWTDSIIPAPATELFATHPTVIRVLAELLIDAGASEIIIMDGLGDEAIFPKWGYNDIASRLNLKLINLCTPSPYSDYVTFPVGSKRQVYDVFYMNAALKELDVFISVGKMKCHSTTGVTLSLKNLIGIAPINLYRQAEDQNFRAAFHESVKYDRRLPRVAIDLNLARPIQLSVIDGIFTAEGGAGPWDKGLSQVKPGVLIASKDPVAADSVATAIMGFEPDTRSGSPPFSYADNHLILAREAGLGTNRLEKINVMGAKIADVKYPFKPAR